MSVCMQGGGDTWVCIAGVKVEMKERPLPADDW